MFGIPAVGTIDTFGRRKWLLVTIPGMALALVATAVSLECPDPEVRVILALVFMLGKWSESDALSYTADSLTGSQSTRHFTVPQWDPFLSLSRLNRKENPSSAPNLHNTSSNNSPITGSP